MQSPWLSSFLLLFRPFQVSVVISKCCVAQSIAWGHKDTASGNARRQIESATCVKVENLPYRPGPTFCVPVAADVDNAAAVSHDEESKIKYDTDAAVMINLSGNGN